MNVGSLTVPVCVALAAFAGCDSAPEAVEVPATGEGASERSDGSSRGDAARAVVPPGDARKPRDTHLMTAEELEAELKLTRAGKVLGGVLRAHGGWDAWRRIVGLSCRLERVCYDRSGAVEEGAAAVAETVVYRFQRRADGRWYDARDPGRIEYSSASDEQGGSPGAELGLDNFEDESLYLRAPFSFLDRRLELRAEYLGVETTGENAFEKIRFSPPESRPPFPCVAYFDTTTHLLSRLLVATRSGRYALLTFSGWRKSSDSEIRFPAERKRHVLDSRFAHARFDKPDCEERLQDLRMNLDKR